MPKQYHEPNKGWTLKIEYCNQTWYQTNLSCEEVAKKAMKELQEIYKGAKMKVFFAEGHNKTTESK